MQNCYHKWAYVYSIARAT